MKKMMCIKCGHCFSDDSNFCPNCGVKIPKLEPQPPRPPEQQSHNLKPYNKLEIFQMLLIFIIPILFFITIFVILRHYFEYDPEFFNSIKAKWNSKNDNTTSDLIGSSYSLTTTESDPPNDTEPIEEPPVILPPEPPRPKKTVLWKYESEYDQFDSTTRQFCYTYSSDKQEKLLIRKTNGKTEVLLSSNYLFRSNFADDFRVRLKFDDNKPYSNGYNDSNSLSGETIFLRHPQKIINNIEGSESLIIEYPSITNGNLRALFSLHDCNSVCKF